jgi:diguanylate cyclase (GGDEF)-like protein
VVADRIRVALSMPLSVDEHEVTVTCSIGISLSGSGGDRVEALLSRADLAMYVAKHNGRDQIALGADEPGARAVRRSVIDLRHRRA